MELRRRKARSRSPRSRSASRGVEKTASVEQQEPSPPPSTTGSSDGVVDADLAIHPVTFISAKQTDAVEVPVEEEEATDWLERIETFIPWLLLALCTFTRYYRLESPGGVVFDEYHFGRFTNQYSNHEFLFDIHPPLGKLVLYAVSLLVGYDHTKCSYEGIQHKYAADCKFLALRATAAFFGSLTGPMMYFIARNWGASVRGAILCSFLFIFDNLNLTESRLILIDSQLFFWCTLALLSAQMWWRRQNEHSLGEDAWEDATGEVYIDDSYTKAQDDRLMAQRERWAWCIWMGIVTSSAISVKWTALATPGMIAIESFGAVFFLRRAVPWADLLRVASVAFALYSLWFWFHFRVGITTADGDAFMTRDFQRTIPGNKLYDPTAVRAGFWDNFFYLNTEMLRANARIDQRHHWESVWWEWPINARGILYYSESMGNGMTESVYLLGNPLIIWPVGICVVLCILSSLVFLRVRHSVDTGRAAIVEGFTPFFTRIAYCLIAYVLNLLPYIFVNRSCFIYHYMPALFYGEIMTALFFDKVAGRRWMPFAMKSFLLVALCSWVYFMPWVYAFPLSGEGHDRRRWLKRWD